MRAARGMTRRAAPDLLGPIEEGQSHGARAEGVLPLEAAGAIARVDAEVVVRHRVGVQQVVAESLDLELAETHAGATGGKVRVRQGVKRRIVLQSVGILRGTRPLGSTLIFVIH